MHSSGFVPRFILNFNYNSLLPYKNSLTTTVFRVTVCLVLFLVSTQTDVSFAKQTPDDYDLEKRRGLKESPVKSRKVISWKLFQKKTSKKLVLEKQI